MEEFSVGDLVILNKDIVSKDHKRNYIYEITEKIIMGNSYDYRINRIFPLNEQNLINQIRLPHKTREYAYFNRFEDNKHDVIDGKYLYDERSKGEYILIANPYFQNNNKTNLSFEKLEKIFKYIPIRYKGKYGFYYNNYIITLEQERNKYGDIIFNKDNKPKIKRNFYKFNNGNEIIKYFSLDALKNLCKFQVINYLKSSKLFLFGNEKKVMVDKLVEITNLELQISVKKSKDLENTVYIDCNGRNLRFSLDDIKIIYPNVNGWSIPKEKEIKDGSLAKIADNKSYRHIKKGTEVKINYVKEVGKIKYASFTYENKTMFEKINKFKVV